jgi:hypothetical protein
MALVVALTQLSKPLADKTHLVMYAGVPPGFVIYAAPFEMAISL